MSDQTIEIKQENTAYYYVEYCKQTNIRINESKFDNYVERLQQPLILDKLKEEFKKHLLFPSNKVWEKVNINELKQNIGFDFFTKIFSQRAIH